MRLKIVNLNTELLLDDWTQNTGNFKRRLGVQQRYGRDGAWISGDRKVSSRTIQLQHDITAETDLAYTTQIEALMRIFYDDLAPFYLVDTDRETRAQIELDSISESWAKGLEKRLVSITINLIMIDAYFENFNESSEVWANAANTNTRIINNVGAVDAYPVFIITALADNFEFSILNNRTQDKITIGTALFVAGAIITVDCQNGTIYLDDGLSQTEISYAIADGTGFLYLDLLDNELEYQSIFGNVDIQIKYRPRYAF
jgi:phage-related protein